MDIDCTVFQIDPNIWKEFRHVIVEYHIFPSLCLRLEKQESTFQV